MSKKVSVNWDDFEMAFMIGSPDAKYFFHLGTGELKYLSYLDDDKAKEKLLKQTQDDSWIEIPRASTPEGMEEIANFIASEEDPVVKANLEQSLTTAKPLLAFNRALGGATPARKRWTVARITSMHIRLIDFCEAHDLLIEDERFEEIRAALAR
ncbi:MAG TPA: hypothetical protein EYN06_05570 [Myxococcales bacterium]|nr:hypothetical protein [Myxococcales bacterium]HIN85932.1 hypothetical protein [Myxococcales bacterium]